MSENLFANFAVNYEEAGDFQTLEPGEYEVVIHDAEATKSKNKGTPELKLTLKVREDIDQPGRKQNIFDSLYATEKAMFRFHALFKALGFEEGKKFTGGLPEIAKEVKFLAMRVKVKHEKYTANDGSEKVAVRVDRYMPTTKALSGGAGAQDDPFAAGGSPGIGDDDLPF